MAVIFMTATDEQRFQLSVAGIAFFDFVMDDGDRGVVFNNEHDLQQGLTLLGLQAAPGPHARTTIHGFERVVLQGQPRRPTAADGTPPVATDPVQQVVVRDRLEVADWNGRSQQGFLGVIQQHLFPVLQKKIVLHAPHGNNQETPPVTDGAFHIWFWGSPCYTQVAVPGALWGIPVDARNAGYSPSGLGTPLLDSGGWPAAELVNDNLYIHWDCCETGSQRELSIFTQLMEVVAVAIEYPGKTPEQIAALKANAVSLQQRRQYITACRHRMGDFITQLSATCATKDAEITDLQGRLTTAIRDLDFAREQLNGLETGNAQALERFGDEFDRLMATDGVCDLEIEGETLKVYTDVLYCLDRHGHNHEIGEFVISIPLNGHGNVTWSNKTRRLDNAIDAPHIHNGNPCLGNMRDVFPQLIAKFQFAALTSVAIAFVQSVNEGDQWGQDIKRFPTVRHKEPVTPAQLRQRRTPVPVPPDRAAAATPQPVVAPPVNVVPIPGESILQRDIDDLLATLTGNGAPKADITPVTEDTDDDFDPDTNELENDI